VALASDALAAEPLIARARERVELWRTQRSCSPRYIEAAYFSPSWTPFQADRGRDFSVIVDGVSN
jgi:hypothetical protein